jgi:hypothetical protein
VSRVVVALLLLAACGGDSVDHSPEAEIHRVNRVWQTEDDLRGQLCERFHEASEGTIDPDAPPSAAQVKLMQLADATSDEAVTRLAVLISASCS